MVMDDKPTKAYVHLADPTDVTDLMVKDHRAVIDLVDQLNQPEETPHESAASSPLSAPSTDEVHEHRQLVVWELIRQLCQHSGKEELVVYPFVRDRLGDKLADECVREHVELLKLLKLLDQMKVTDDGCEEVLREVVQATRVHIDEQERELLPLMKSNATDLELVELGRQFNNAALEAPTRPHPSLPTRPPFSTIAAFAAKPLDAVKDVLRFH